MKVSMPNIIKQAIHNLFIPSLIVVERSENSKSPDHLLVTGAKA